MESIIFCFIFGIVVVFFFSKHCFTNYQHTLFDSQKGEFDDTDRLVEPAFVKHLTTRLQFILSLSLFVLSTIVIFGVIGQILPFLLPDDMSRQLTSETKVITAALIISGIMPNFPYKISIDKRKALAYIASA